MGLRPFIEIKPTEGQLDDLLSQIEALKGKGQRCLVATLTMRMAEELAECLREVGVKTCCLHSGVKAFWRAEVLQNVNLGIYDVVVGVVGINLLHEVRNLPAFRLVAIVDGDMVGRLRSKDSLTEIMECVGGHAQGHVVVYADNVTESMKAAIDYVQHRHEEYRYDVAKDAASHLEFVSTGSAGDTTEERLRAILVLPPKTRATVKMRPSMVKTSALGNEVGYLGRHANDALAEIRNAFERYQTLGLDIEKLRVEALLGYLHEVVKRIIAIRSIVIDMQTQDQDIIATGKKHQTELKGKKQARAEMYRIKENILDAEIGYDKYVELMNSLNTTESTIRDALSILHPGIKVMGVEDIALPVKDLEKYMKNGDPKEEKQALPEVQQGIDYVQSAMKKKGFTFGCLLPESLRSQVGKCRNRPYLSKHLTATIQPYCDQCKWWQNWEKAIEE